MDQGSLPTLNMFLTSRKTFWFEIHNEGRKGQNVIAKIYFRTPMLLWTEECSEFNDHEAQYGSVASSHSLKCKVKLASALQPLTQFCPEVPKTIVPFFLLYRSCALSLTTYHVDSRPVAYLMIVLLLEADNFWYSGSWMLRNFLNTLPLVLAWRTNVRFIFCFSNTIEEIQITISDLKKTRCLI